MTVYSCPKSGKNFECPCCDKKDRECVHDWRLFQEGLEEPYEVFWYCTKCRKMEGAGRKQNE